MSVSHQLVVTALTELFQKRNWQSEIIAYFFFETCAHRKDESYMGRKTNEETLHAFRELWRERQSEVESRRSIFSGIHVNRDVRVRKDDVNPKPTYKFPLKENFVLTSEGIVELMRHSCTIEFTMEKPSTESRSFMSMGGISPPSNNKIVLSFLSGFDATVMRMRLRYEWGEISIQLNDWLAWILQVTPLDCTDENAVCSGSSLYKNLETTTSIEVERKIWAEDNFKGSIFNTSEWALLELCTLLARSCIYEVNSK